MSGAGAKLEGGNRAAAEEAAWRVLERVPDPEIPVLSVVDLGIIRHVRSGEDGRIHVGVAPTYSGCPATEVIRALIKRELRTAGLEAQIEDVLAPPWSSDWISEEGRRKLKAYRHRTAGEERDARAPPFRLTSRRVSALRFYKYRARERIRLDALQGALPMPRVRRAVRSLQVHLISPADPCSGFIPLRSQSCGWSPRRRSI